ncbi:hypothetical protein MASR2M39_29550 [Ignavibacteriales bacterium]
MTLKKSNNSPFYIFIIALLFTGTGYSQWEARVSMGINVSNTPDLRDYINENFAFGGSQMPDFNSMIEFAGEAGFKVGQNLQIAVEGAYSFNSYTNVTLNGKYEMSYKFISPSVMLYRVVDGNGYSFKFGGGVGPRFVAINEIKPFVNTGTDYNSTGFGIVAKASGSTALSKSVFAYISADARYDAGGTPTNKNGVGLRHRGSDLSVTSLSVGVKLGISINF